MKRGVVVMMWLGKRRLQRAHRVKDYTIGEVFRALAVVSSVVESVSESGARSVDECKVAEGAVAALLEFFDF